MKTKDEIRLEIFELAQKISRASSEVFLLDSAREIYERAVLLRHAPKEEAPVMVKQEEKPLITAEVPAKPEPIRQATIDLFSTDTAPTEAPASVPVPEKPAPKERKEPKKKTAESVAEKLQHNKITDLKSSIGINEKFQFINELFEGNMKEYTVAVDQINSFSTHGEAESYIANLEEVYKWQPDNQIAENFKELIERRFA